MNGLFVNSLADEVCFSRFVLHVVLLVVKGGDSWAVLRQWVTGVISESFWKILM